jgi:hypothetical protein
MKVVLLAPARLSRRPDLARLVTAEGAAAVRAAATTALDGWRTDSAPSARGDGVIVDHEVVDDSLVPTVVWQASLQDAPPPAPGCSVEAVQARVTSHGLAVIAVHLEAPDLRTAAAAEDALCPWVNAQLGRIAAKVREVVADRGEDTGGQRRDMREDGFLWWHRLLVGDDDGSAPEWTEVDRHEAVELRRGVRLRVGNGYSQLQGGDERDLRDVVGGLVLATQVWLVADRLQRRLTEHAGLLRVSTGHAELDRQQRDAADLTEQAALETQVLLEEIRYTEALRLAALQAACRTWQVDPDLGPLVRSIDRLRQSVERRLQQRRDERAAWLNRLLVGLTVVGALSVVLAVFETTVGEALPGDVHVVRLAVGAGTVLVGVVAMVVALRRG